MAEKVTRRRRRLLVPLLGLGVAAWAVRRRLGERHGLDDGWQQLPPAPRPVGDDASAAPATSDEPPAARAVPAAMPPVAPAPRKPAPVVGTQPADTAPANTEPADAAPPADTEPAGTAPADTAERPRARAVPAATAAASVTAPALADAPFGPGSLRARADGSSPDPEFAVKGKTATKVFHAPGGAYYTRTRADVWFRSAHDARAAGFTERTRRHH
jgi:hypothetical protein